MNTVFVEKNGFRRARLNEIVSDMESRPNYVITTDLGNYYKFHFNTLENTGPTDEILEKINELNNSKEIKYKERRIEDNKIFYELLTQTPSCTLATITDLGTPDIVPLSFVYVPEINKIFFHSESGEEGQTVQNIKNNPDVCLNVHVIYGIIHSDMPCDIDILYSSINVKGKASIVEDESMKIRAMGIYAKKFMNNLPKHGHSNHDENFVHHHGQKEYKIIQLDIEQIIGKENFL